MRLALRFLAVAVFFSVSLGFVPLSRECAASEGEGNIVDPPATSPGDPSYAGELVAQARALHLWKQEAWIRLGHWYVGASGDWRGQPDGPAFFLAPGGKTDPQAELEATLRGIWAPEPTDPREQHPFCRFPARMAWLDEQLHFDGARMPSRRCAKFEHFARRLRAESVSMVFSSYYLSSPASAFGHTFLRLHKAGMKRESQLLDTGIDYAAIVDTPNALLYAIRGLTGLFPGVFSSMPYYYKVREYNDYESRDLWEYELNLSPHAVAMMVAHLWELGSTYFDYYYLSENCSYHSLALLGVAEPTLHLMEYVKYPTVPIDTVRALFKNPGLVRQLRYRPSLHTTVRHELDVLSGPEVDAVAALLGDPDAPLPAGLSDVDRARVLDAANELVDLRDPTGSMLVSDPKVAAVKQRILERRAEIVVAAEPLTAPLPTDKMPHMGHAPARVSLGTGYTPEAGGGFYEAGGRVALHDLADAPDGYPETSQIEFLPTRLRFYPKPRAFELEDLWLVRVVSLPTWARFEHPLSFAVRGGAMRLRDAGCFKCLAGDFDVAGGATIGVGHDDTFAFYLMGDASVLYSPTMNGLGGSTFRVGVGPVGGLRWRLSHELVWTADGSASYLPAATTNVTWLAETTARWEFTPNFAAGLDLRRWPLASEGSFSMYFYY